MTQETVLNVKDLWVQFEQDGEIIKAVNGMSFRLERGGSIGIVGESGCGKTVTGHCILGLLPSNATIKSGEILFTRRNGERVDLVQMDPEGKDMRSIRGGEISIIFQEPMSAFSPVHTINDQISENLLLHTKMTKAQARERVKELLALVGIPNPEQRLDEYPFQLSGGMRQRAMIAMALACSPSVVIADEPTTALDVTIQAQVMKLIKRMQSEFELSLILITHDLGVVTHMVDYVFVAYLGQVVEEGPIRTVLENPLHPYTYDLIRSIPKLHGPKSQKIYPIEGSVPSPINMPTGCAFHPRCKRIQGQQCRELGPKMVKVEPGHQVRCFIYS